MALTRNINYNLRNLRLVTGFVRIQAGGNVGITANNDVELTATAGSVTLDTDGGIGINSGAQMSFFGTNTLGLLAGYDIRMESGADISLQGLTGVSVQSTGDVSMGSGRDFLTSGTLVLYADKALSLSAGRNFLATSDSTVAVNGASFTAKSGYGQSLLLSSGTSTTITAGTRCNSCSNGR